MIYPTQEWKKNTIGFQSESSPKIGLQVTPESNSQKRIVINNPLQLQIEIIYNYKILNKIDNQAVVNYNLLIFYVASEK